MSSHTVLVADDDSGIRTVIGQALERAGYQVRVTGTAATLWRWISDGQGDVVVTDVVMPDENGLDLIPRIRKIRPELRVIVMSAQNTLLTAVKATERGAFEYLPKPFDLNELIVVVRRALEAPRQDLAMRREEGEAPEEQLPLIGRSPAMQEIYRTLARLMATDLTVLITGESGTGKELVARALHDYGKRRSGPFVAINMAAIPRELIESELFGHEKGAFTGASHRSAGRFEQAEGGTLFLDEIGDMPPEAQTRLLRVLQEGEYTTVGGRTPIRANVRIVAATHHDLRSLISQGLFREDLYFRLNVVPMRLPPLRERSVDIPELVRHFMGKAVNEGLVPKIIDSQAMERLKACRWPGNVRELENLVRRLAALYSEEVIGLDVIEAELADASPSALEPESDGLERLGRAPPAQLLFDPWRGAARARPVRPDPPRGRTTADRADAGGDPRQSDSAPPKSSASTATRCARRFASSVSRSSAEAAVEIAAERAPLPQRDPRLDASRPALRARAEARLSGGRGGDSVRHHHRRYVDGRHRLRPQSADRRRPPLSRFGAAPRSWCGHRHQACPRLGGKAAGSRRFRAARPHRRPVQPGCGDPGHFGRRLFRALSQLRHPGVVLGAGQDGDRGVRPGGARLSPGAPAEHLGRCVCHRQRAQ